MDDELVIVRGWRGKEFPIRGVTKSDLEQALAVLKKVRSVITKARADAIKNFKTTYPNFRRLEERNRVDKEHPEDCPWRQPLCELYLNNRKAVWGSQILEELLGLEVEDIS